MPLIKRRRSRVFTADYSTTGQGPGPYFPYGHSFNTASGETFDSGSHVNLVITALGAYTAPLVYQISSSGVGVSDTNSVSLTGVDEDKLIDVKIINAAGTYTANWTGSWSA